MASRDEIYQAIRNADKAGDTASVQKLAAYLQTMDAPTEAAPARGLVDQVKDYVKSDIAAIPGRVGNLAAGAVRGAGSIGATLMIPVDAGARALGVQNDFIGRNDRRTSMDATLKDAGADPNSIQYQVGKVGAEVAGTSGVGGALANGARAMRAAPAFVEAIRTGGMAGGGNMLTRIAGGAVSGAGMAGLVDPEQAGKGAVIGAVMPPAVKGAGMVGNALYDLAQSGTRRLMQSAIKPTLAQRASGDADVAIDTMLEYGLSPSKAGVEKIKALIDTKNNEIAALLQGSKATVGREKVLDRLGDVRDVFRNQVDPMKDLGAIEGVADRFATHPAFSGYEPTKQQLEQALAKAASEKVTALQAAGKLQTMAAQQRSLAEGGTIGLSKSQPEFQPYYNTGSMGREATSPSSLPVPGYPRIPARYTNNIDRVQEGESGAQEAMSIYASKRAEEAKAAKALADFQERGASMPVQQAQKLKQGTYRVLQGKYGEVGSAETEAQKGLARGLKEEIAQAVPGIQGLNAEESRLIKTLDVAERRALLEMNKNPAGLSALAHNPLAAISFMADRSAAFKSLAARMIHNAAPGVGSAGQALLNAPSNALLRAAATSEVSQ